MLPLKRQKDASSRDPTGPVDPAGPVDPTEPGDRGQITSHSAPRRVHHYTWANRVRL